MFVPPFPVALAPPPVIVAPGSDIGANSEVRGLLVVGSLLYCTGSFTQVYDANNKRGVSPLTRNRAACLDLTTGLWTSWNPNFNNFAHRIYQDQNDSTYCFIVGDFSTLNGSTARVAVARVSLSTGLNDSGFDAGLSGGAEVLDCSQYGSSLYLVGQFTAPSSRYNLTKHSTSSGAVDATFNSAGANGTAAMYSVLATAAAVYAGGSEVSWQSTLKRHFAKFDPATGALDATFDPEVGDNSTGSGDHPWHIKEYGGNVRTVGRFTTVASGGTTRNRAVELNPTTGAATSWDPNVSFGIELRRMVDDGSSQWLGGQYTVIGGASRTGIAKVNLSTGVVDTGFNAGLTGAQEIDDLALYGSTLIIAGNFDGNTIGGSTRYNIAFVDKATGALI